MKRDPRHLALAILGLALGACSGSPRPAPAAPPPAVTQPAPVVAAAPAPAAAAALPLPNGVNLDTVKAGKFDFGKMWTFEFPPIDYFRQEYGFTPDRAWFDHARLGALRLPNCSASFVSPNGLMMSNHHCAREALAQVSKAGEDLSNNGLYVKSRADERAVEDTHVDQLMDIVDVTDEIDSKLKGVSDEDRADKQEEVFDQVKERDRKSVV